MIETDIDKFKLNSNDRELSLKISIIDNKEILMVLTNKTTQRKFTNLFSLPELKNLSKAFYSSVSIKDAYLIIKNTIKQITINTKRPGKAFTKPTRKSFNPSTVLSRPPLKALDNL